MADPKSKTIPRWQRQEAIKSDQDAVPEVEKKDPSPAGNDTESRASLIEQATEFLEHEDIRDASTDRKIAFLESKGLNNDEIQQLLGISRNIEASSSSPEPKASSSSPGPEPSSSAIPSSSSTSTSTFTDQQTASTPPPIITYPEFLLHASRPAPLITKSRLLKTLYTGALTGAAIHATSTYVLQPMLASLTQARLSLLATAATNVDALNEKLEGAVSTIPPHAGAAVTIGTGTGDGFADGEDADSEASDPAELFHRDAGVQTSPPPSRSASSSLSSPSLPESATSSSTPATRHTSRLHSIRSHLSSVSSGTESALDASRDARSSVAELQGYLEDLQFGRAPPGRWDQTQGVWVGGSKDDEVARVKAEIKGVKGVLLSARSFPGGRRGGALAAGNGP